MPWTFIWHQHGITYAASLHRWSAHPLNPSVLAILAAPINHLNEPDAPERDSSCIRVYTDVVRIVKVRRVGNSNVVSIPREFEANGYTPGTSVLVEELPGGELRLLPTEKLREHIQAIGRRVVADHPGALRILAEHDPDR